MNRQIGLTDACALFALDNKARRLTEPTQAYYAASLRMFSDWCAAQCVARLDEVTPALLRRYQIDLQARTTPRGLPLSAVYIHNLLRAVRRFCAFCVEEEILTRTPFHALRMPQVDRKVLQALTVDEVGRVLRACGTPRDRALVGFLLDTGVRAAEACSLCVGDVDLHTGAVTVTQGKGRKGRYVFAGVQARKRLRRYLAERESLGAGAPLFATLRGGRRLTVNAIVQLMRRLQRATGIAHLTAHTLRRTFAISCLRDGMDVHTLRVLMGHTDIDVLRQYLDFARTDLQAAHEKHSPLDRMTP